LYRCEDKAEDADTVNIERINPNNMSYNSEAVAARDAAIIFLQ
jgi:hypothetical protein